MKAAELREMTHGELEHRLEELYQEQFNLRFQAASRQLADTSRVRQVRREIARVKTVMAELTEDAEV
ncbi:MAG: 50S ribosomal protein L29 [Anaerolineae bacterium]